MKVFYRWGIRSGILPGDSVDFMAYAVDGAGAYTDVTYAASWSADSNVFVAGRPGNLVAVGAGTGEVRARYDGVTGALSVAVDSVRPTAPYIDVFMFDSPHVGSTANAVAQYVLSSNAVDRRDPREFGWSSSDPTVATVNSGGAVTGHATGTVTITARLSSALAGTYRVSVFPREH